MLRQIITPVETNFTLQLPNNMIGKTVEIIAFEINDAGGDLPVSELDKLKRLNRIQDITKTSLVDLSSFKFDRNEVNNYTE